MIGREGFPSLGSLNDHLHTTLNPLPCLPVSIFHLILTSSSPRLISSHLACLSYFQLTIFTVVISSSPRWLKGAYLRILLIQAHLAFVCPMFVECSHYVVDS